MLKFTNNYSITGNVLCATALAAGTVYLAPYFGEEEYWITPVLLFFAGLHTTQAMLQAKYFLQNQWKRYRAKHHSSGLKGDAHWATHKQIRKAGLHKLTTTGVFLGVDERGNPICDNTENHVLVEAPTGSGKTSCIVMPNVFNAFDVSCFIIDIKGDILETTANHVRKNQGKELMIFDPANQTKGKYGKRACYNPVTPLLDLWYSDDPHMQRRLVSAVSELLLILLPEPNKVSEGDHFRKESMAWLECLLLYMITHLPRAEVTLTRLLEIVRSEDKMYDALAIARMSDVLDGDLAGKAEAIQQQLFDTNDRGYTKSIRDGAVSPLRFATPSGELAESMSSTNCSFKDLKDGLVNCHIIIPPNDIDAFKPYTELLLWAAFRELTQERNNRRVLFFLDEMLTFRIPQYTQKMTLLRQYGCKLMAFVQTLAGIEEVYGDNAKEILLSQCGTKLFLDPQSPESMKLVSDYCGKHTVNMTANNMERYWNDIVSDSISEQEADLISLSQARMAPFGFLFFDKVPPIQLTKMSYAAIMPYKKWQGVSGFFKRKYKMKTQLVLGYRTLHNVMRYRARQVMRFIHILTHPCEAVTNLIRRTQMATVKIIRKTKTTLAPKRIGRKLGGGVFKLFCIMLETVLPLAPLAALIWLFLLSDTTPHLLIGKDYSFCNYLGMNGYVRLGGGDCPFITMLP